MRPEFTKKPEFMRLAAEQKCNELSLLQELLRFFLLYFCASLIAGVVAAIPMTAWMFSGERGLQLLESYAMEGDALTVLERIFSGMPDWLSAVLVASTAMLIPASIFYCKKFEQRQARTMGLVKGRALRNYLIGALLGAVSFSAVAGLASAFGGISIQGLQPLRDVWPTLLMMLAAFIVQSAGEELLVRGYLMVSLSKRFRLPVCILVSSLMFGVLHVSNIGFYPVAFVNIVLIGVILGCYILLTGDIWGACGYHALWNFFQGNIFGLPVSGLEASGSLCKVAVTGGNKLLTGGSFGLEGSLCTTLVLLPCLGILIFLLTRRPEDAAKEAPEE